MEIKLENIRNNLNKVTIGGTRFWFSYETIIAFNDGNLCVCEKEWSNTTGRHLNMIDGSDKKNRISHNEFQKRLEDLLR